VKRKFIFSLDINNCTCNNGKVKHFFTNLSLKIVILILMNFVKEFYNKGRKKKQDFD